MYFACWLWKWPQKFSQQFCSCRNCFQTFDQMIFGTLTFPGTRWQVLTVRDPQMVRDQNKFGKHWLNASIKQEAANCLLTLKPWQRSSMHGTELLQMSWSDKQNMHSKLVSCLLQPILLSWRQNNSSSHFRHSTKMYVVHHNTLSDSYRIWIVWFQPKQDSDRIRISFFKNRIGSDSKNPLSDHFRAEMIAIRLAGWISSRIMSLQPDTDIQKLLSNGSRILLSNGNRSCYRCHGQLSRTCVPSLSFDYFNQSCSVKVKITLAVILPHGAWSKIDTAQKMYVVHHNTVSDSFRIRIAWFQPKQDTDRILFFKNRIGSDSENPLSDHLCQPVGSACFVEGLTPLFTSTLNICNHRKVISTRKYYKFYSYFDESVAMNLSLRT